MSKNVIITCAVTGSAPLPDHPDFPVTPQQIARAGLDAAKAGASILHIHVRDPRTGEAATELELYREAVRLIRAENRDVILNVTTGPGCMWYQSDEDPRLPTQERTLMFTAEQRVEHILDLRPDMCTLDICTMNLWGGVAINLEPLIIRMCELIRSADVLPEIECFEAGDFVYADDLMAKGVLPKNAPYSFVLGTKYGLPATPEAMMYSKNQIRRGAEWTGFGVSRHSYPMAAQAILLGGNIRVGFEDTIYMRQGRRAKDNADLVRWGADLVDHIGLNVASTAEARERLGLPAKAR